jgi:tape measure domain-containing protein
MSVRTSGGGLHFDVTMDDSEIERVAARVESKFQSIGRKATEQGSAIESFANKAAAAAAGFLSLQAAEGFVTKMIQVRGEFQQIEIAFRTMLGSKQKADQLMAEAVRLAAITPFTLQDVASGAKQLLAYGFAAGDITKNLTMLGNIASGVGSQLSDVVYLYGTLKASGRVTQMDINQFAGRGIPIYEELAKVMSTTTDKVRDYVSAGQVGFPQIEKAFNNMTGPAGKFFNLMQEQSKSLTGQLSNLEDAWDRMLNAIGQNQEGILSDGIQAAISMVDNYQKVIEVIELLVITYGAYRAALLLTTLTTSGLTAAELLHYGALEMRSKLMTLLTSQQAALAVSTAAYTAVLAALVAVGYSLVQYQDAAEIAENSLAEARDKGARAVEGETEKIDGLLKTIKDHSASKREQKAAYDSLLQATKGALDQYSQEEIAAGKGTEAINKYKESVCMATEAQQQFADFKGLEDQLKKIDDQGIKAVSTYDRLRNSVLGFLLAIREVAKGNFDEAGKFLDATYNKGIVDTERKKLKNAQGAIVSANPEVQRLIDAEKLAKQQEENAKVEQARATKTAEQLAKEAAAAKKYNSLLEKRKDLEREISQDLAGARAMGLSEEDRQVQAINAKYDDRIAQIEKLNKQLKPSDQVSTKPVESARMIELGVTGIDTIINGKGGYKEELEAKKKLFTEYEQAKLDVGQTMADNLFKDQVGDYTSFLEYITKDIESRRTDRSLLATKKNETAAPYFTEESSAAKKKYADLLKEYKSYNDQRQILAERYNADISILENNPDAKAERTLRYQDDIKVLDDSNVQRLSAYKTLFEGIDRLSDINAKKVISNAQKMLQGLLLEGKVSKELATQISKMISDSTQAVENRLPDKLIGLANTINDVASSVSNVDEGFGRTLNTLADVIGQVGNFKKNLIEFNKEGATGQEKFAAGANMVATGIGAATSLIGIFTNSAKARKKAEVDYYASVLKFQNDYNLSLNEEIRLRSQIADNVFVQDLKGKIQDGTAALVDANSKYLKSLQELQKGQAKLGQRNAVDPKNLLGGAAAGATLGALIGSVVPVLGTVVGGIIGGVAGFIGGLFGGKKKKDVFGGLLQEYPELIQKATDGTIKFNDALAKNLIANNLVDDKTKALLQNTMDLAEARKAALEQINSVISDLAGNLGNDLQKELVNAFRTGEDSAKAFGKTVEGVLENIVAQMLFAEVFGDSFDKLQKEMKESYDLGGDQNFVDDITRFFNEAGPSVEAYNAGLKAAQDEAAKLGFDLFGPDKDGTQTKSSGIASSGITASQESVDVNNAIARSNYEQLKMMGISLSDVVKIASQHLEYAIKTEANTFRIANNTDNLNSKLDKIEENTNPRYNRSQGWQSISG